MLRQLQAQIFEVCKVLSSVELAELIANILGFCVAQVQLIFRPICTEISLNIPDFLTYSYRYDIVPQAFSDRGHSRDPVTGMYIMKRALRSDGSRVGDVVPLNQARIPVRFIPRFGPIANPRLNSRNSVEYSTELFLNKYSGKEAFFFLYLS